MDPRVPTWQGGGYFWSAPPSLWGAAPGTPLGSNVRVPAHLVHASRESAHDQPPPPPPPPSAQGMSNRKHLEVVRACMQCALCSVRRGACSVPVGACGCLWVPVGACGCLWVPVGACGCLWVPVGSCGCLWVPVGACGCLWVPVGACGCLWAPVGARCLPRKGRINPDLTRCIRPRAL